MPYISHSDGPFDQIPVPNGRAVTIRMQKNNVQSKVKKSFARNVDLPPDLGGGALA